MRVDFTTENKSKGNNMYPKFTLEKDETARVAILESPVMKYVHALQAPIVDPMTGEHQKVTKKTTKGDEYETEAYEFVSQFVCSGDLATVQEREVDPDNCPACKDVTEYPDRFKAPDAKYVCHIVRYKTQPGTIQPQNPFQAELMLWVLTQRKFDKIVNIASEFGDPRTIDLQVGPCMSKNFQNYEMAACHGPAVWGVDENNKNFVSQLWSANAADEEAMSNTVARPLSPTKYASDAAKVNDRYSLIGSPQAQNVGSMEFGALAQSSQQAAMQNEQPAPWSQPAPQWAQPQQQEQPQQQAAPMFGQQQEQTQQQPAQAAPMFGQGGGQSPAYSTSPMDPSQQWSQPQPTEQPQQFQNTAAQPQPTEQPQQFQNTAAQPQPTQSPAFPTEQPQQQQQQPQQPQQFQNTAAQAAQQAASQPQQQPQQQNGGTLDFNALMAQMQNPQG